MVSWLLGLLVGWLVGWFLAWLVILLVGWLVGWILAWLVGWLVGYTQIEGIDHTDIQTDKRNAERDLQTKETHWINTPSTKTHLALNYISTDTIIQTKKPIKYNTTQPTPDPTYTNTTPK